MSGSSFHSSLDTHIRLKVDRPERILPPLEKAGALDNDVRGRHVVNLTYPCGVLPLRRSIYLDLDVLECELLDFVQQTIAITCDWNERNHWLKVKLG